MLIFVNLVFADIVEFQIYNGEIIKISRLMTFCDTICVATE